MHAVDQPRLQILPDRCSAAANAHVARSGSFPCAFERSVDAIGDEMKRRTALHFDRRPSVMCQHEHRRVRGRVVAPPALPRIVCPGPADRTEHVAAEDPGADPGYAARSKVFVDAGRATILSDHRLKEACRENPFVQGHAAETHRMLQGLTGTGAISVDRNTETVNAKFCHPVSFHSLAIGSAGDGLVEV